MVIPFGANTDCKRGTLCFVRSIPDIENSTGLQRNPTASAVWRHQDFKKDVLIKVGKSVKMRGLFKPGKERTLQIKCNVRICAVVERDKKGKKRAVKITSIICSKVEGAGSRKIWEES